jgi:hypothetical protein
MKPRSWLTFTEAQINCLHTMTSRHTWPPRHMWACCCVWDGRVCHHPEWQIVPGGVGAPAALILNPNNVECCEMSHMI